MRGSPVRGSSLRASQWVSRLTHPTGPSTCSAQGLAMAKLPQGLFCPITTGTAPARSASLTLASTAACAASTFSGVWSCITEAGMSASP